MSLQLMTYDCKHRNIRAHVIVGIHIVDAGCPAILATRCLGKQNIPFCAMQEMYRYGFRDSVAMTVVR